MKKFQVEFNQRKAYYSGKVYQNKMPFLYQNKMPLTGVYDITHAIAHRWERNNRKELEIPLLRHYHHQLNEKGVDNYTWQQLVDDYALCAGMGIYDAVERSADGPNEQMKWLWLPMLQRSLQVMVDLEDTSRFFI